MLCRTFLLCAIAALAEASKQAAELARAAAEARMAAGRGSTNRQDALARAAAAAASRQKQPHVDRIKYTMPTARKNASEQDDGVVRQLQEAAAARAAATREQQKREDAPLAAQETAALPEEEKVDSIPSAGEANNSAAAFSASGEASVYRRLERANTSSLLDVVRRLPLREFEFKYDSVSGRRQLGLIGEQIEEMLPEAVQIGRRAFATPDGPLFVNNFAIVDQNAIYMQALGATQELAKRQIDLEALVQSVSDDLDQSAENASALAMSALNETEGAERKTEEIARERERRAALAEALIEARADAERKIDEHRAAENAANLALEQSLALETSQRRDETRRKREESEVEMREAVGRREGELRGETEAVVLDRRLANEREIERLKRQAEIARVEAEAQAKAEADRANEDVRLRLMRAKASEDRKRVLAGIALAADYAAKGARALIDDPKLLAMLVGSVVVLVAAGFFSREAAEMARHLLEAYFGRPSLVRETSRMRFARIWRYLRQLRFMTRSLGLEIVAFVLFVAKRSFRMCVKVRRQLCCSNERRAELAASDAIRARLKAEKESADLAANAALEEARRAAFLDGVVLADDVRARLTLLAASTRNAKRNRAPFRHALLYGPPGTGKTMTAVRLAKASGLSYALMSGGDVGPLGADGVTALHSLFRWARASDDGVLIFIDEAEAFLASRSNTRLTEHMRNALNAFLYQTGTPTSSFIIVLATNRPTDLDPAVLDRVDETLFLGLPDLRARQKLVPLYFDRYLNQSERRRQSLVQYFFEKTHHLQLSDDLLDSPESLYEEVAIVTEGFSGREIEKLLVAVQSVAYARAGCLDRNGFDAVLQLKLKEHDRKADLTSNHTHIFETPHKPQRRTGCSDSSPATVSNIRITTPSANPVEEGVSSTTPSSSSDVAVVVDGAAVQVATAIEEQRDGKSGTEEFDSDNEEGVQQARTFPWTPCVLLRTPRRSDRPFYEARPNNSNRKTLFN